MKSENEKIDGDNLGRNARLYECVFFVLLSMLEQKFKTNRQTGILPFSYQITQDLLFCKCFNISLVFKITQ